MTREFRLTLAEQGAADPELMGTGVSAAADPRDAEIARLRAALKYARRFLSAKDVAIEFINAALAQSGGAK